MKTNYYSLFAAAALLGLASCSSDEPNNGSNNGGLAEGENYMAFTISNVGGNSRAAVAGTPANEDPVGNEGNVTATNVRFFFYDANGNAFNFENSENVNSSYDGNMVTPSSITPTDPNGDILTGVLVLGKADETANHGYVGAVPSQVLCVANAPAAVINNIKSATTLNAAIAKTQTTNFSDFDSSKDFMMTSATWVKDGEVTVADDNIEGYIKTTPEAAKNNPITINIERLAAKVRAEYDETLTVKATSTSSGDKDFVVDGKKATFTLTINGWQLIKTAETSAVFKQLKNTYDIFTDWTAWNGTGRSYWAESVDGTLQNTTYDILPTAESDNFTHHSYGTNKNSDVAYCYENTRTYKAMVNEEGGATYKETTFNAFDRTNKENTAIAIKATLKMQKEGETEATAVSFCKWFGTYYTQTTLEGMIKSSYESANVGKTVIGVRFEPNTSLKNNSYKAQVNIGTAETANWVDAGDTFNSILWWQNGVTSYYLNIEHLGKVAGVVRNHIYDYTFENVIGLGYPGNDDILPTDQETYVAAKLNILNWNVIKNTITLE